MNRRDFLVLASTATVGGIALACAPPYRYSRQAPRSPLLGARAVFLEPMHFETMMVGNIPEAQYLAGKTPEQQASFQADKQEFANRFAEWMGGHSPIPIVVGAAPDPSTYALRPLVTRYEPGVFTYVFNRNTEVDLAVQLVRGGDGALVEEITTRTFVQPSFALAASGSRMRVAGENLGRIVGAYLQNRVRGAASNEHWRRRRA